MISFPGAKINIGLNVLKKRADGYHDIETVFYPIPLCDILEIADTGKPFSFTATGFKIPGSTDDNLVVIAYRLLKNDFRVKPVEIHLHKLIPPGSGLGGGSSDGAFALKMLNDLFQLNLSEKKLLEYALELGSDCPFFIKNRPVFASGRGNIFRNVPLDLSNYFIAVVIPEISVSTTEAFRNIAPAKIRQSLFTLIRKPVYQWKNNIRNDFEKCVFNKYPVLSEIKEQLYSSGAIFAAMSGSGSALYGIFRKKVNLKNKFSYCSTSFFSPADFAD
ncbi:MAG: 4-(cytidine 5'-diphospho)-2-C-methyl-D-erythritol kinase [Bacteroidetes bacterium]|nr:4-(cytidine 5'-diphospho)-2-C-methyl-D-erythritol kinase [Bacteroidota bacterium]